MDVFALQRAGCEPDRQFLESAQFEEKNNKYNSGPEALSASPSGKETGWDRGVIARSATQAVESLNS